LDEADGGWQRGRWLFNRQRTTEKMTVSFSQIEIQGEASVRDLWLKKDLETSATAIAPTFLATG